MIPESERARYGVKVGGDRSFKMTFQICNIDHPNSPANTCAFCVPDSVTNLRVALQRFQDEVDSKTWRINNYNNYNKSCVQRKEYQSVP